MHALLRAALAINEFLYFPTEQGQTQGWHRPCRVTAEPTGRRAGCLGCGQGGAHALLRETLADDGFLNFRPSKIAAAVVYAERRARGAIPFWPSVLAKMTHYEDMASHELSLAIKAR